MNLKELIKEVEKLQSLIKITKSAYGLKEKLEGIKQTVEADDDIIENDIIKKSIVSFTQWESYKDRQKLKKLLGLK